jgi:diguanylate cyclase (GGDEF)-like protein
VQRYGRGSQPLTVLMIDVDHFKNFNDTYGHAMGDQVLVKVGQALRASLRPTDHVARYGGEEFLVILPDTGEEQARTVADRLRTAVHAVALGRRHSDPAHHDFARRWLLAERSHDEDAPRARRRRAVSVESKWSGPRHVRAI